MEESVELVTSPVGLHGEIVVDYSTMNRPTADSAGGSSEAPLLTPAARSKSKESGINMRSLDKEESQSLLDLNCRNNGNNAITNNGIQPKSKMGGSVLSIAHGAVISFKSVNFEVLVKGPTTRHCCGKKERKFILNDVSGVFRPAVNAIMGPTGSGKTTLLDVIAGRKKGRHITGSVLVDGQPTPSNFKYMSGYVMQDDLVMGMLTVRENVMFSATLRLPSSTTALQRQERVDGILTDLGLNKCADTRVGSIFVRGISGGERKRANIAMELITSPAVLFLDEPTSGLDATTAYSVMYLLKRLSERGMTIVVSLHQPRYTIYKLFDSLTLLSRGETVYHGPSAEALKFFKSAGYLYEDQSSPPDFFLDIINASLQPSKSAEAAAASRAVVTRTGADIAESLVIDIPGEDDEVERQRSLVQIYQSSKWYQRLKTELDCVATGECLEVNTTGSPISYTTSFCQQFAAVSLRSWRCTVRNRHALMTQICSGILLGLLAGSIYFRIGDSPRSGIQNRVGAFFFIVMNYVYGNMSAVDVFMKERVVFIHETVSGYYRVSAYFFAKLLFDVIPQRFFPIIAFALISYFMIGFDESFIHFFFFLLNVMLTCFAGTSVALLFSATTRQHSIGTILTATVWTVMMVYSGLIVMVDTIPQWLQWIKWFSIFRYSMNAFTINELHNLDLCPALNSTQTGEKEDHIYCNGNAYMTHQKIRYEQPLDLWINEIALVIITFCFLAITYIQLRRTKTFK